MKKGCLQILLIVLTANMSVVGQTLEDYMRIAAENHAGLKARYKNYKAALSQVAQVNSLPDPTLSFGYFISPVETRLGPQHTRLSLSQMFPWFGTLKARGDAAALLAQAEFQAFIQARNTLYFQVAEAYFPLYKVEQNRKIEEQNLAILQSYKALALEKLSSGSGTLVDVIQVGILIRESETALAILELEQEPRVAALNELLNRGLEEPVSIADPTTLPILNPNIQESLAEHPLLQGLDYRIESAVAAERAAVKNGLPRLGVGLDYAIIGEREDMNLPENGKDALMPMVSISLPLYRKPYQAAREQARLHQQAYQLQKTETHNTLAAGLKRARFEIKRHRELLALYDHQIQESQQALDLLLTAYSNSEKDIDDVLRMRQQLLHYEKLKVASLSKGSIAVENYKFLTAQRSSNESID